VKKDLQNGALRVIDANFNRAKEGLRVIEDILRFIITDETSRKTARHIRHKLTEIIADRSLNHAIKERDPLGDPGKKTDRLEMKRASISDLAYANLQRAKESLRVLEEFYKLISPQKVAALKRLRYRTYFLEKRMILCLKKVF